MWTFLGTLGAPLIKEILSLYMKTRRSKIGALALSGLKKNLSNYSVLAKNVWIKAGMVVITMAGSDYLWAKYIATVASGSSLAAANWGSVVVCLGSFVVISYVEDKRMIIPATIGAWIGTYLAV